MSEILEQRLATKRAFWLGWRRFVERHAHPTGQVSWTSESDIRAVIESTPESMIALGPKSKWWEAGGANVSNREGVPAIELLGSLVIGVERLTLHTIQDDPLQAWSFLWLTPAPFREHPDAVKGDHSEAVQEDLDGNYSEPIDLGYGPAPEGERYLDRWTSRHPIVLVGKLMPYALISDRLSEPPHTRLNEADFRDQMGRWLRESK